jgi:hypothetical protein
VGVAISLGCGAVTAPILWIQFGYLPILGVLANALAEPAMPILLGLAFATAGLDTVAPSGSAVLAWLNGWTAAYIAFCARVIGSPPFAEIKSDQGLAGLAAIMLVVAYGWHRLRRRS